MGETWDAERAARFGEVLARARAEAGLSQREVAQNSRVTHAMISGFETRHGSGGKPRRPRAATVRKLALGLTTRRDGIVAHGRFVVVYEDLMVAAGYAVVDD